MTASPRSVVRAAWRHVHAREAVEVVDVERLDDGHRLRGVVSGVEAGAAYAWSYVVEVGPGWRTRRAAVRPLLGGTGVELQSVADASWRVDGVARPDLDGLVDVDLECSVVTNTVAVQRLVLGDPAHDDAVRVADAAYVGLDGTVSRLVQSYGPVSTRSGTAVEVEYAAPTFGVACRLTFDASGLVVDYPGLATRLL